MSREGAERVIRVYLETAPSILEGMREAVASKDLAELAELAHRFRSSSGMLGASGLAEICGDTEERARNQSADALELVPELIQEFERVAVALEECAPQAAAS